MIYVISHKKYEFPKKEFYEPLIVGKTSFLDNNDKKYITDGTGDNISTKNQLYCELTGLYWIWKNTLDEYVGLVHYRRYFVNTKKFFRNDHNKIYSYSELVGKLNSADIILPKRDCFSKTVKEQMIETQSCSEIVFELLQKVIKDKYPDYLADFYYVFSQNKMSCCNMIFSSRDIFDQYCSWLFDVLFQLETLVNKVAQKEDQSRLYGFLSERLLNIWVRKQGLKVKYLPIVNIEDSLMIRVKKPLSNVKQQIKFMFHCK